MFYNHVGNKRTTAPQELNPHSLFSRQFGRVVYSAGFRRLSARVWVRTPQLSVLVNEALWPCARPLSYSKAFVIMLNMLLASETPRYIYCSMPTGTDLYLNECTLKNKLLSQSQLLTLLLS